MFAQFFVNMGMHPELRKTNGERTMVLYQAETRLSWYKDNEKGDPFDLVIIMEETLDKCRNETRSQDHAKALKGPLNPGTILTHPRPLAKLVTSSKKTTTHLIFHVPFAKPFSQNYCGVTDALAGINMTSAGVHEPHYGTESKQSSATGTEMATWKSQGAPTWDSNYAQTGSVLMDAPREALLLRLHSLQSWS
ncbi:hypothetical protein F5876DRAFT_70028 [Lentinula aff. lateritia]|uniref:Uncharacterized protein n=1 Tax=Lentinula aff. lateritia TaxID=2804960 RepID=A0ACC1TKG9_9AGAR|nr:hypothetical protein F5876DRAFT_70028 [Lentinula aff. lateritia]